jgi:hypothetical protein
MEPVNKKMPGLVEISVEYSRNVGPKHHHGGVTLSFDSAQPYSFSSEATWPAKDNYEAAIRGVVERELLRRLGSLSRTRVVLRRITWDPVSSCQVGFEAATRGAIAAAFES